MKHAWLAELHRQWLAARGGAVAARMRPFVRAWDDLLGAAGVHTADAKAVAAREAEVLERQGRLVLWRPSRRRYLIERIALPLEQEAWLQEEFHSVRPSSLHEEALAVVSTAQNVPHPLLPDLWPAFCQRIAAAFTAGRSLRPFYWRQPEAVRVLLSLLYDLTCREWPPYTLVRDACVAIGRDTKALERHQAAVESALTLLFERPMSLDGLGIISSNSRLLFDGPLTLEFADGSRHEAGHLRHGDVVTAADLARAARMTTTASRILSVENSKTTFRNLAVQNEARDTLLVATSFPTQAVRLMLEKLPADLPHFHFGDTDPAGYFILAKLREVCPRRVAPWQMDWRDKPGGPPLTGYDRRVLERLLTAPNMDDMRPDLQRMSASGRKGEFEQETRPVLLIR